MKSMIPRSMDEMLAITLSSFAIIAWAIIWWQA
ncbi:hypothetical protein Pat9b_1051 [Pantoea sp. At-9b]|jgi:hypothetical protein|nr:hypothetical protein Pat9b_1051 [Pantoea sp. At-9b]